MNRRDFLKLSGVGTAAVLFPHSLYFKTKRVTPSTFEQVLATATKRDTLLLADGIYPITAQILEVYCSLVADVGARPVLVRANGYTPSMTCHDDVLVEGLWFGGARDETTERGWIHFNKRATFRNNVLWNYYGGIGEGGGTENTYRRNVFVNCGTGSLYHSIYINNSDPLHTAFVRENIFIGGQAYHIHLWHGPTNTLVNGNFSADADACFVLQGTNNTVSNNIWWKPSAPARAANMFGGTNNLYRRNFHGPLEQTGQWLNGHPDWFGEWNFDGRGITTNGNHYYPQTQEADQFPVYIAPGSELSYLGKAAAQIDGAVSALKTAFSGTVQGIHDNLTINGHISTLQSVINKWKS